MRFVKSLLPVIGLALLAYLLWKIGITKIIQSFAHANYILIWVSFLIFIPIILIQTAKWSYILKKQGISLRFKDLLGIHVISLFYESVTPARIGYFMKIAYLQQRLKSVGRAASSVIIDRALDFISVAILAFFGSLVVMQKYSDTFYISLIILLIFIIGFLVILSKNRTRFFARFFYRILIPAKMKENAKNSFDEFYKTIPSKKSIIALFFMTLVFWIIVYSQAYMIARAFSLNIPYLRFLVLFPISIIVGLIPITISGFGARELVLVKLMEQFGKQESIVSFSVTWAFLSLVVFSTIGLSLIFREQLKSKGAANKNLEGEKRKS